MTDPAAIYDAWFVPVLFAPVAEQMVAGTALPPQARVLDVGCGTGIVARTVAARLRGQGAVTGLDLNPAMLAVARQAADAAGMAITWVQGDAQALPFPEASFDLVFCQQAIQFLPDRAAAVAEMHRVLAPGGEVAVACWRGLARNPFFARLAHAVEQRTGSDALATPYALDDPRDLAGFLQQAGFRDVSVEPIAFTAVYTDPDDFVEMQITASAAGIRALQGISASDLAAVIDAVRADMAEPLRETTVNGELHVPVQGMLARGARR
ncbi:MAG: methyltransferase domain-containing protein [Thermomicrobiales bacterium]|nr:methyltransferase domain-containing protein [Thermomicrobiales bacterium]